MIKSYFFPHGEMFRYTFWFRITQWAKLKPFRKIVIGGIAYLNLRRYEYKYGIHLNTNIHVGSGLHIVHGDGVYLNCKYIGENFTCFQGVTLGLKDEGIPIVKDNVSVFPNAVICGDIILNDNCKIGAQSYLTKNVLQGVTVAGCPAKPL